MSNNELLDWAEKAGIENLRGRLATGDHLLAQANTLLSILVVGIGGGLAYAVKLAEAAAIPLVWGMAGLTVWLCGVAAVLAVKCVFTRDTQVLYNEPSNLYQPHLNLPLNEMREFELRNLQERINLTIARNVTVSKWLDGCRIASIATPVPFILSAAVAVGR